MLQFLLIAIYSFYYYYYFKKREIENSSVRYLNNGRVKNYIMGNSMVETDLNDTLIVDNCCNIGKGAEPIFYSVVKSRYLICEFKQ